MHDIVYKLLLNDVAPFDPGSSPSEEQWLEDRKHHLTATDMAAVLGLSPWASCADILLQKRGLIPPAVENEPMYWGKKLEPVVAQSYLERDGGILVSLPRFLVLHSLATPFLAGTPDFFVIRPGDKHHVHGLEIKTARLEKGWAPSDRFGETDITWNSREDIPIHYYIQVQSYLAMLPSIGRWDLCVLIGGNKLWVYRFKRDEGMIAAILEAGATVFQKYIENPSTVIPQDLMEKSKHGVSALYPVSTAGKTQDRGSDKDFVTAAIAYATVNNMVKVLEAAKSNIKGMLAARLADAEKAVFPDGSVSYKSTKAVVKVDLERRHTLLMDTLRRTNPGAAMSIQTFLDTHKNLYTAETPGTRRFLVTIPALSGEDSLQRLYGNIQEFTQSSLGAQVLEGGEPAAED